MSNNILVMRVFKKNNALTLSELMQALFLALIFLEGICACYSNLYKRQLKLSSALEDHTIFAEELNILNSISKDLSNVKEIDQNEVVLEGTKDTYKIKIMHEGKTVAIYKNQRIIKKSTFNNIALGPIELLDNKTIKFDFIINNSRIPYYLSSKL